MAVRFLDVGDLLIETETGQVTAGGRRPAQVLSTLLMHLNRRVAVDLLLDAVWGDDPGPRAVATLETHVWRLRRLLEPQRRRGEAASLLLNDSGGYRLVAAREQVDSARFEQLCLDVLSLLNSGQPERALRAADEATSLWRGAPYEVVADRPWAAGVIARLHELSAQLAERRVDAMLATGQAARAVVDLEPLIATQPFRERLWWQRMLALYRTGRSEEALQSYQTIRRRLHDEVGVEPGRELAELQRRILSQDPGLDLRPTSEVVSTRTTEVRLPRPRVLIGRDVDVADVTVALDDATLLTVTGAAGCGKTRLAIEAARAVAGRFPDGVWFVDLSQAEDTEAVEAAVLAALGLLVGPGSTAATAVAAYGRDHRGLLVLDNCEQALDAVAALCDALLGAGGEITVLATSREPVGLPDEVVHRLAPLPWELPGGEPGPAVTLFVERAQASVPILSDLDRREVLRICRAVGGLPLAIELAAALAATFGLSEIADIVESDPGSLSAVGRGHDPHHQSLATAIDRSYRLLTEPEQMAFRRLAVIPSGFTRDLAGAVLGDDLEASAVTALLARLVNRSLLGSVREAGRGTWFEQLAPLRAQGSLLLAAAGETEATQRRRDEWVVRLVHGRPRAGRPEERQWYDTITANLPTIRAALKSHLLTEPDELGAGIAPLMVGYCYYHNLVDEGRHWCEAAMRVDTDEVTTVCNRLALATHLLLQGRADLARPQFDDGVAPAASIEPLPVHVAELLLVVAGQFAAEGDPATARRALGAVRGTVRTTGDPDLAVIHRAITCIVSSLSVSPDRTLAEGEASYRHAVEVGNLFAAWASCSSVNAAALARRDPRTGLPWSRRLLSLQWQISGETAPHQLETLADFLALDARHAAAVAVFSLSYQRARRGGAAWPRNPVSLDLLSRCRAMLTTAAFDAAWARGLGLGLAELTEDLVTVGRDPSAV